MIIIGFLVFCFLLAYNLIAGFIVIIPLISDYCDMKFSTWFAGVSAFVLEVQVFIWIKPWLITTFPNFNWS